MKNLYQVGEVVKISRNGERFWNEVIAVISDSLLLCRVDNHLHLNDDINYNSIIVIDVENIVDFQ